MSLELKANICKPCDGSVLQVIDTTGLYNSNSASPYYNLTGYNGASTVALSNVTNAVVRVFPPDPTTLLPVADYVEIDVFNQLPNVILQPFDVTEEQLGQGWDDGFYRVDYVITASGTDYTWSQYVLVDCGVSCCVQTLATKCTCSKSSQQAFSHAYDLLTELRYAAKCGNINQGAEILNDLKDICAGTDCTGCGSNSSGGCGCH